MKLLNDFLEKIAGCKKCHFWLFFIVLCSFSLLMIFAYQPLCPSQDFFFHFRRLQALMDGMGSNPFLIYLDYNAIDGYGYFTKAFYPDVILVPFAFIGNYTGIEFAYQLMIFTMTVLCGVFTYLTANRIYKDTFAASVAAFLYTFCVYRLLDLYHRAALGEALSFTFLPIVFLGLYHIIKGDYRKWYILAIGYSLMIFTHLLSSVLMLVTILILLIIYYKPMWQEKIRIRSLLFAGLATLLIVSYYIFPMLEQMFSNDFYYETRQIMSKAQDARLDFHWIIWGLFSGLIHQKQAFIPGIGILLTGAVVLRLFVHGKSDQLRGLDILVFIGLAYILASSILFPWSVFPFSLLNFIQLPWRLYEFTSFFFAIAGGYYLSLLLRTHLRRVIVFVGLLVLISFVMMNDSNLYREFRCERSVDQVAEFSNDYHLGGMEYIPEKVPSVEFLSLRGDSIGKINPQTTVSSLDRDAGKTAFTVNAQSVEMLELPLIYYKGYSATLDKKGVEVSESNNGLVQISVPQSGKIEVYYGGTFVQKASWFISILSILALCVYIVRNGRNKYVK